MIWWVQRFGKVFPKKRWFFGDLPLGELQTGLIKLSKLLHVAPLKNRGGTIGSEKGVILNENGLKIGGNDITTGQQRGPFGGI